MSNETPFDPVDRMESRNRFLAAADGLISGDRNHEYGGALEDFTRTGRLWAEVLGLIRVTPEQVALCMALVKISRLTHNPTHADSWVDICGYAALGGDISSRTELEMPF